MDDPTHILVVDDDEAVASAIADSLVHHNEQVECEVATTATAALDQLDAVDYSCVVADYDMREMNGLELLQAVRAQDADIPFILCTGRGNETIASKAFERGATDYVVKSGDTGGFRGLAARVETAVDAYRTEQALRQEKRRTEALLRHSPDPIVILNDDPDVTFQYISPAIEQLAGYDPETVIGDSVFTYIHPEDREDVQATIDRVLATPGEIKRTELRFQQADDTWQWVDSQFKNRCDDPAIGGIVVNSHGITQQKRRERELEQYEQIVSHVGDAVWIHDTDGTLEFVNEPSADVLGTTPDDVVGQPPTEILASYVDAEQLSAMMSCVERILAGESDQERVEIAVELETETRYLDIRLTSALIEGERRVIGLGRNINERKRQQKKLEQQNERLDQFARVVSHDLRNPLHVASGHLELVAEECDSDHIKKVERAHDRMETIVSDVLQVAREGTTVEEREPVELSMIATMCWQTVATADATLDIEDDKTVLADRSRLEQLFENILRNAIKHGGDEVTVKIGTLRDESGFYIADDGVGIPVEDRSEIFEMGYSTGDEGTGFGLAIVKQIVDAHGWTIRVTESDAGGTRFEIVDVE